MASKVAVSSIEFTYTTIITNNVLLFLMFVTNFDYDNLARKPTNFSRGMNCLVIFLQIYKLFFEKDKVFS